MLPNPMTIDDDMESTARDPSPGTIVGLLYLVIVTGLAVGVIAFGHYFIAEHQRLSVWEGVLVWLGDGVTLLWATAYFARHTVLGVPMAERSGSPRRLGFLWFVALLSILASLGTDLWITLSLRASEQEAFGRARRAVGTIHSATKTAFEKRVAYGLQCSYVDANQVVHTVIFQLRDPEELPKLAPAVVQAVREERLPVSVTIAYDVDCPRRSWLADLGWQDMTRMHGFSLCVLLFQAMGSVAFFIALGQAFHSTRRLPWWYDLHALVLLAVEAAFVLLFGGLGLLFHLPFFWGDL
jgi:hypothetical protein